MQTTKRAAGVDGADVDHAMLTRQEIKRNLKRIQISMGWRYTYMYIYIYIW